LATFSIFRIMALSGSNGLLFMNLGNKAVSPSKSGMSPLRNQQLETSMPLPKSLPSTVLHVSAAVPAPRYSQNMAVAAAAESNKSPKRARGEPAQRPVYLPRKSKVYPVTASPALSVPITAAAVCPQHSEQLHPFAAHDLCDYEVELPRVSAVAVEAASVSTRWDIRICVTF
jgi:hypothetical protein